MTRDVTEMLREIPEEDEFDDDIVVDDDNHQMNAAAPKKDTNHSGSNEKEAQKITNVKSIRVKCQICKQRACKDGCPFQCCFQCCTSDDCQVHQKQRAVAQWKQQVLLGTTPIQVQAQRRRKLRIGGIKQKRSFFHETNFVYQGDTVVIWDIQEYMRCDTQLNDALRKSIRRNKLLQHHYHHSESSTACHSKKMLPLRNNRRRFHRIMNDLYHAMDASDIETTTT